MAKPLYLNLKTGKMTPCNATSVNFCTVHGHGKDGPAGNSGMPEGISNPLTDLYAAPDISETYLRFQQNEPGVYGDNSPEFERTAYNAEWLAKLSTEEQVAYLATRALPAGLGEDQAKDVFEALKRSAKRWNPAPEAPTKAEWSEYLAQTAERLADPDNGLSDTDRQEALQKLAEIAAGPKPDGVTFAVMSTAPSRTWRARYALDDHARQIGSWIDADEWEVKSKITEFRNEYYDLADAGEKPEVPAKYYSAWKRTGGVAPKDEATAYAHWKAEDPTLYLNPTPPKKFVALDLETTGLSTREHHIIEIGLVEYDDKGREIGRWSQLVKPPVGADGKLTTGEPNVVAVHQIQVKDIKNAPSFAEIMPELKERLNGATIIGHNLGFDTKHLRVNLKNHAPEDNPDAGRAPWVGEADTLFHASRHMEGLENNKLVTVSSSLGIPYTNGHRAEHDAAVAGEVFFAVRKKMKAKQARAIKAAQAEQS